MDIAGVVVHTRPADLAAVQAQLEAMAGVEIHGVHENGRLVVTVEEDGYRETSDTVLRLRQVQGVLNASLVYQHSEDIA
jgi:nitrate reductase NapD